MSSSSDRGAFVVFGSGPGIGVATAGAFAKQGFSPVILVSRNKERLQQDAQTVRSSADKSDAVATVQADLADPTSLKAALQEIDGILKKKDKHLECVLFNAATVAPTSFFDTPTSAIEDDFRTQIIACYSTAAWALPQLAALSDSSYKPAFLCTSSLLPHDPLPYLFSLSLCKAAQYNLIESLYKQYTRQGIHCGLVLVGGFVKPDAPVTTPDNIAQKFVELWKQDRCAWTLTLTIEEENYQDLVTGKA